MPSYRKSFDIVAYAYDGDIHCEECAYQRFGNALYDDVHPPTDSEGNEVHPVFLDEVEEEGLDCGECGDVIEEGLDEGEDDGED